MVEGSTGEEEGNRRENKIPGEVWHGVGAAMGTGLAIPQQTVRKVGNTNEGIKE